MTAPDRHTVLTESMAKIVEKVWEDMKVKIEQGQGEEFPPFIALALQEGEVDLTNGKIDVVAIGASIDGQDKEPGLRDFLWRFRYWGGYGVIMHADTWQGKSDGPEIHSVAELKKVLPKTSSLLGFVVTKEKVIFIKAMAYEEVGGKFIWNDITALLEGETGINPFYQRVLLTEEDFK